MYYFGQMRELMKDKKIRIFYRSFVYGLRVSHSCALRIAKHFNKNILYLCVFILGEVEAEKKI